MSQTAKAEAFRKLHRGAEILVLPNAWDAASAAVMADAGAKAVATSSAAVAWAHGYADGDLMPVDKAVMTVAEVVRVVDVPVTADFEGGYTDDLGKLVENVTRVIEAGAVGINLEDGGRSPELHAAKIEAIRTALGDRLFVNARTDVYLRGLAEGHAAYAETIARAERYRAAGADGIFVPGPADADLIGRLAGEIHLPLNVMAWPGMPAAARLQALGVRRLSSATHPFRLAYAALARAIEAYVRDGDPDALARAAEGAPALQKRFS
ncbi:isocitrate lyase/phosphoenolpyruvate mutase family protein [Phenylobacterium sp. J426]|uniref:isocitrate lyase/PEP mutase family protein n=1 Tax=Phenylobacterium sp. J426 TaxID=2898439 RepID=UPI0021507DBD|nr:isocitrate lyase/phosphoenolpyruvate mutase family protein [Phenylobacterium sp. J426]MCR5874082.1 isocitrate lyase/phosphoenolpyruvate mutase family protein [Phenylobacterium sp. J426]